jgi:sulfatase maturation enzyme AslB (radical SAM superfamily)
MSTFVTSSGRDMQEKSDLAPSAFHMMLKPRGAICNLDCAYCY